MDGEGHRVQIALEVEAGLLDEALVLGIVRDGIVRAENNDFPAFAFRTQPKSA